MYVCICPLSIVGSGALIYVIVNNNLKKKKKCEHHHRHQLQTNEKTPNQNNNNKNVSLASDRGSHANRAYMPVTEGHLPVRPTCQ